MAQKTIGGYITADGTIKSGTGFTVDHDVNNTPGVYTITFDTAFNDVPAVTVTDVKQDYKPGWWCDLMIAKLTESKCEVVAVEDNDMTKQETDFTFIAVGTVD